LVLSDRLALLVENEKARRSGALINGTDKNIGVLSHLASGTAGNAGRWRSKADSETSSDQGGKAQ